MKAVSSALVGGILAGLAGASTLAIAPAAVAPPQQGGANLSAPHAHGGLYKASLTASAGVCRPAAPGHAASCGCAACAQART